MEQRGIETSEEGRVAAGVAGTPAALGGMMSKEDELPIFIDRPRATSTGLARSRAVIMTSKT